jgi:tRNA-specific 2-thiouridylase
MNDPCEPYTYSESDGTVVGTHEGAHYYTIGQRKGLGVGGKIEPLFVIATDVNTNTVYVGMGDNHPGLKRSALQIINDELHWVRPDLALQNGASKDVLCRIRYRQPLQEATLKKTEAGLEIHFKTPQKAIAAGQFAAWYDGAELVGSGVIHA